MNPWRNAIRAAHRPPVLAALAVSFGVGATLAVVAPLRAADGDLDGSFWGDGRLSLSTTLDYEVAAVVSSPSGAAVVVGTRTDAAGNRAWFWRTVRDTTADIACIFPPLGGATAGRALAAAFDGAGRLVVAGSARYGVDRAAVARFLYPNCALDASFDGDGYYTLDVPGGSEELTAIDIAANGLAFAGYRHDATDTDLVVLRLQANGTPYTPFSGDGWLVRDVSGAELDDSARGVHLDAAGRVIVGGTTYYGGDGSNADFIALRFLANGALDTVFGDGGLARIAFDLGGEVSRRDVAFAMAVDPENGAILLAGEASAVSTNDLAVARLTGDGDPDTTFSGDGRMNRNFGLAGIRLNEVLLDGLDRITVAGTAFAAGGNANEEFFAARFTGGGATDTTFSTNGWTTVGFDLGPTVYDDDRAQAAAFVGGRLVLAGESLYEAGTDTTYSLARLDIALLFADGFERGGTGAWSSTVTPPIPLD